MAWYKARNSLFSFDNRFMLIFVLCLHIDITLYFFINFDETAWAIVNLARLDDVAQYLSRNVWQSTLWKSSARFTSGLQFEPLNIALVLLRGVFAAARFVINRSALFRYMSAKFVNFFTCTTSLLFSLNILLWSLLFCFLPYSFCLYSLFMGVEVDWKDVDALEADSNVRSNTGVSLLSNFDLALQRCCASRHFFFCCRFSRSVFGFVLCFLLCHRCLSFSLCFSYS